MSLMGVKRGDKGGKERANTLGYWGTVLLFFSDYLGTFSFLHMTD